jgi:hypothetical protein
MVQFRNDGALDLFTVPSSLLEPSSSHASKLYGSSKLGIASSSSSVSAAVAAMGAAVAIDSVDSIVFLSSTGVLSLVFVNVSDEKHNLGLGGGEGLGLWLTCPSVSESGYIIRAIWQMV